MVHRRDAGVAVRIYCMVVICKGKIGDHFWSLSSDCRCDW